MAVKKIERICKTCKLFDPTKSECSIVVIHEGQRVKLPVIAEEPCFFESTYFDPSTKSIENFIDGVELVRFWVENKDGEKTDGNGIVKMECSEKSELFFNPNIDRII